MKELTCAPLPTRIKCRSHVSNNNAIIYMIAHFLALCSFTLQTLWNIFLLPFTFNGVFSQCGISSFEQLSFPPYLSEIQCGMET